MYAPGYRYISTLPAASSSPFEFPGLMRNSIAARQNNSAVEKNQSQKTARHAAAIVSLSRRAQDAALERTNPAAQLSLFYYRYLLSFYLVRYSSFRQRERDERGVTAAGSLRSARIMKDSAMGLYDTQQLSVSVRESRYVNGCRFQVADNKKMKVNKSQN